MAKNSKTNEPRWISCKVSSIIFQQKQNVYIYSKTFGTKPKLFDVFQLFLAKAKRYYLFQKLRNKTKTFWFSSQISKTKTERYEVSKKILKLEKLIAFGPQILKSERERFGSIMNFVSKMIIFDFFRDVSRKMKANDLKNVGLTLLLSIPLRLPRLKRSRFG
jgi:hypothetical protein